MVILFIILSQSVVALCTNGIKHASCFYLDPTTKALCVDEGRWEQRYLTFKSRIKYWLENVPDKEITLEQSLLTHCC
jgi:hypothetical protein